MKKVILVFLVLLGGCKQGCDDPKSPASVLAGVAASKWGCNQAQAQKDLGAWFAAKGLCQSQQNVKGIVGNLVCPALVESVRKMASNQIPASWACDQSKIGADAAAAASALCMSVFPF